MKYTCIIVLLLFGCNSVKKSVNNQKDVQVSKIWDSAAHNAFTDLIRFNGMFYCSFREGSGHMPGTDGKARIIRSADGNKWESVALLEKEGFDLRDPKLSVTADNRIMVIIGGSIYDRITRKNLLGLHPQVSFSDANGLNFSTPAAATIDAKVTPGKAWIWKVIWHKGIGYGINYPNQHFSLMATKDGKIFNEVSRLDVDGSPNESAIRFDKDDNMYVMSRREDGDQMGMISVSAAPYKVWKYIKLGVRIGGPDFLFYKDKIIIGTRLYTKNGDLTGIRIVKKTGEIEKTIELPSKGDTSYPGMLLYQGKLWMSYYSSHEGKTSIYLAKVPLRLLK